MGLIKRRNTLNCFGFQYGKLNELNLLHTTLCKITNLLDRVLKEKSPSIHKMLEDFNQKLGIDLFNYNTECLRSGVFMSELQLIQTGSDTGHVQ